MANDKTPNIGTWLAQQKRNKPIRSVGNVGAMRPRMNREAANYLAEAFQHVTEGELQHIMIAGSFRDGTTYSRTSIGLYGNLQAFVGEIRLSGNKVEAAVESAFDAQERGED